MRLTPDRQRRVVGSALSAILLRTLGFAVGFAVTAAAVLIVLRDSPATLDPALSPTSAPPPAASPVEDLIAAHGCWVEASGAEEAVPGHVVATLADQRLVYGGARLTGQALEQVFDGVEHGLTVHAFCP